MKYFIIEGNITNPELMNDDIMKEHMAYTQKAMDKGLVLMSGLKEDMSGGLTIMKSESLNEVEEYLSNEPLKMNGIQDYKVLEFSAHYFNPSASEWFQS
ncbi:YciI family protein [Lachnoclostridium phytofermentans]|uniref:YCII-related n=1 Tax=Lachnoclostridium phytofermentans (strain ATCC 700394 / DSM 18823 / ISDg) TaxID=357809 RepID=A9KIB8_LACP7|nr:YciI family protein [Lachnoclostridium phytofermentans]ABX42370.1 YCII-related [Lachnoclostridium phytofermentans ISDg]